MLLHHVYLGKFIVGRKFIYRTTNGGKNLLKLKTPPNLIRFIRQFDLSAYPDLIAPPPRVLRTRKPETRERNAVSRHKRPRNRSYEQGFAQEVGR